jgi:hypothetical protein
MKAYSFLNNTVLINGVPVTQWSEDNDAMKIERAEDSVKSKVGVDGKMAIAINANKSGKLTIKLMQTSPMNKVLEGFLHLQEDGPQSMVPIAFLFQDSWRQDIGKGAFGYIVKQADIKRGGEIVAQEWSFMFENISILLGDPGFAGFAAVTAEASL